MQVFPIYSLDDIRLNTQLTAVALVLARIMLSKELSLLSNGKFVKTVKPSYKMKYGFY